MSDFKDRARDAMDEAGEKAKDAFENALDIVRDKLDTFRKLDKTKQQIILALVGAVVVAIALIIFWPRSVDVTITLIIEPVAGNAVVIKNNEQHNIGKTTVIMDDLYETTIPGVSPGETISLSVTQFKPGGQPEGSSPGSDFVPQKSVSVKSSHGARTQRFDK